MDIQPALRSWRTFHNRIASYLAYDIYLYFLWERYDLWRYVLLPLGDPRDICQVICLRWIYCSFLDSQPTLCSWRTFHNQGASYLAYAIYLYILWERYDIWWYVLLSPGDPQGHLPSYMPKMNLLLFPGYSTNFAQLAHFPQPNCIIFGICYLFLHPLGTLWPMAICPRTPRRP